MKVYLFAVLYVCNLNLILFNRWLIFLLLGSIFVPQIVKNTVRGRKAEYLTGYTILASVHILLIPTYFKLYQYNFMYLEPKPYYSSFLVGWVCL